MAHFAVDTLDKSFLKNTERPNDDVYNDSDNDLCQDTRLITDFIESEYILESRSDTLRSGVIHNFKFSCGNQDGWPVEIMYSRNQGRYLAASRDIEAGEVIFKNSPILLAPKAGSSLVCLACLRRLGSTWVPCENCGFPLCSPDCEGTGHILEECRLLKRLCIERSLNIEKTFKELSVIIAPLRMYLLKERSLFAKEMISALQSHKESRKMLQIGRFIEDKIVNVFQEQLGLGVDSDTVHHLCGALDTNCFEVSIDEVSRARAVFTLASMLNHSCLPNTQRWYLGGQLVIRAATNISKGEPITTTYTQTLWGTNTRLAHLWACKMFWCTCNRCRDPTELGTYLSSVVCRRCQTREGILVPPETKQDNWKCSNCGIEVPESPIQAMVQAGSAILNRLDLDDRSETLGTLKHLTKMLGNHHYIIAQLKNIIVENIMKAPSSENVSEDDLIIVMDLTEEMLFLAKKIEPELSRFRGSVLLHRIQAFLELLKRHYNEKGSTGSVSDLIFQEEGIKGMLGQLAECEFILMYDQKMPDVLKTAQQLRAYLTSWKS